MELLLKSITRKATVDIAQLIADTRDGEEVIVKFKAEIKPESKNEPIQISGESLRKGHEYIVRVKQWMTKSGFDFMKIWNRDTPMPLRVMRGRVLNETRGMVYMELKGCPMNTQHCMKCGKPLSHPVSMLYGLGPECGSHFHINPFETEEELNQALDDVRKALSDVTWSGWIAKSGIESAVDVTLSKEVFKVG